MSNPLQDKAPVLKEQRAQADETKTAEQQTFDKLQNSAIKEPDGRIKLITGITKYVERESDGSTKDMPDGFDPYQNKSQSDKKDSAQSKLNSSYPEAQMSHDATGKLNHIDFKPDKDSVKQKGVGDGR